MQIKLLSVRMMLKPKQKGPQQGFKHTHTHTHAHTHTHTHTHSCTSQWSQTNWTSYFTRAPQTVCGVTVYIELHVLFKFEETISLQSGRNTAENRLVAASSSCSSASSNIQVVMEEHFKQIIAALYKKRRVIILLLAVWQSRHAAQCRRMLTCSNLGQFMINLLISNNRPPSRTDECSVPSVSCCVKLTCVPQHVADSEQQQDHEIIPVISIS